jgi:hypothetical protein
MAKSLRSKVKKRLRKCRGEHLYQTEGKARFDRIAQRLNDPTYNMKQEYALPTNAFLEPNNPNAVFPQKNKAVIRDFRSHKMENGGLTATNVFRKDVQENAKKSKYATTVVTAAELESGEKKSLLGSYVLTQQTRLPKRDEESEEEMEVEQSITVDELTNMASKMKIAKKKSKKSDGANVEMLQPKIEIKSKGIKKHAKVQCKKSKKMMKF